MAYTADDLVTDVRRSGMFPDSSAGATASSDILAHADKEMRGRLVPLVCSVREEWYVKTVDTALTADQAEYRLPEAAIGGGLRQVQLVFAGSVFNVPRVEPSMSAQYAATGNGIPSFYYLRGAALVFLPAPSSAGITMRLHYRMRPGSLQLTSTCKAIATASLSAGVWSLTSSSDLSTAADIVAANAPFETLSNGTVTRTGSGTYTVPATGLPGYGVAVGDWLCPADTSPVVQLPVELHGVLAQRVVARMLLAQGSQAEAAQVAKDCDEMEREALRLLAPRTEGEVRKLQGSLFWRNRKGYLGRGY